MTQAFAAPTDDVRNFNRRDRGILLYLMKRYPEATEALSEYLQADPEVGGAQVLPCLDEPDAQTRGELTNKGTSAPAAGARCAADPGHPDVHGDARGRRRAGHGHGPQQ
jgi:hypothetical protein